jgi:hypothetical protein
VQVALYQKIISTNGHINPDNVIGPHVRIEPAKGFQLAQCVLGQGSQILRVPPGSRIANLRLGPGASHRSRWAQLRGGVLKLAPRRTKPLYLNGHLEIEIDGQAAHIFLTVPTGYVLMDRESFEYTCDVINKGVNFPHRIISNLQVCREDLWLVHAGYCHPDDLLLPQERYHEVSFQACSYDKDTIINDFKGLFIDEIDCDEQAQAAEATRAAERQKRAERRGLFSFEDKEDDRPKSIDVSAPFEEKNFSSIMIQLKEGGSILLRDRNRGKLDTSVPIPWKSGRKRSYILTESMTNVPYRDQMVSRMRAFAQQRVEGGYEIPRQFYWIDLPAPDFDGSGWDVDFQPVEGLVGL